MPVNILGGVGIISIAAGIAFQTVLGNMFAGLVVLGRDKYRIDDQLAITADEPITGTLHSSSEPFAHVRRSVVSGGRLSTRPWDFTIS